MTIEQAKQERETALMNMITVQQEFKTLTDLAWSVKMDTAQTALRIAKRTVRALIGNQYNERLARAAEVTR